MDTRTGRIVEMTEEEHAEMVRRIRDGLESRMVPVDPRDVERLQAMPEQQRKAWGKNERKRLRRKIRANGGQA